MPTRQEAAQLDQAQGLLEAGRDPEAEKILRKLVRRNRRLVRAHDLLGSLAAKRNLQDEARDCFRRCHSFEPDAERYCRLAGRSCAALGDVEEALRWFDLALERDPQNRETIGAKALALENKGRAQEVIDLVTPLRDKGDATIQMISAFVRAKQRLKQHEEAIEAARHFLDTQKYSVLENSGLRFYIAKSQEKLGRYDEAFESYRRANATIGRRFDRKALQAPIEALMQTFTAEAVADFPRSGNASRKCVFIAGMPRSGTTLIEQIIDAHPQAKGLGELTDIEVYAANLEPQDMSGLRFPACMPHIRQPQLRELATKYLARMQSLSPNASRAVNKSLHNWFTLGLISLLFPGAYIIDCRRDPLDTCTSCYMSELHPSQHPYSTDLRALGVAYRLYERLMEHWHEVLEMNILRVQYEDVVADLENQARRMIDFLELTWDDACVRFHESGRSALSISYEQVQQPIYNSSVGRAERFGSHLDPLREALAEPVAL